MGGEESLISGKAWLLSGAGPGPVSHLHSHDAHCETALQDVHSRDTNSAVYVYTTPIWYFLRDRDVLGVLLSACMMYYGTAVTKRGAGESVEIAERSRSVKSKSGV